MTEYCKILNIVWRLYLNLMSDKPSSFINIPDLPQSVGNAIKNATDKPTLSINEKRESD